MRHSSINPFGRFRIAAEISMLLGFAFALTFLAAPSSFAQSMTGVGAESSSEKVSFETVQPILRKHCVRCHNEDQPRGDLVLTSLDKVLAGSSSGPVVIPGKLDESPLYTLTAHLDTPKMPPNKPQIPQRELNAIERWIVSGLGEEKPAASTKPSEMAQDLKTASEPQSVQPSSAVFSQLRSVPQAAAVRAVAKHPNKSVVALAGLNQVAILDSDTNQFLPEAVEVGEGTISALRFSPDGKILLIAFGVVGESGKVLVLDWTTKQWLPSIGDEPDNIQSIDCNEDASQVATGTTSRLVKTFDRITQKELYVQRKHTDWVLSVSYSPDGLVLASGDRFGWIHVWESDSGKEFATLRGHAGGIKGLVWSRDGNWLISASLDGSVRVWNMHTFETTKQWVAHERGVLSVDLSSDNNVITCGRDGWIRKWSLEDSTKIAEAKLPDEGIAIFSMSTSASPGSILCNDAAGGIHQFAGFGMGQGESVKETEIRWPLSQSNREFASIAPIAPKRIVRTKSETVGSELREPSNTGILRSSLLSGEGPEVRDLEESRRALATVEQALEQTYLSAEQLEESVARLKQLIVLQEARIKQSELHQKPGRK